MSLYSVMVDGSLTRSRGLRAGSWCSEHLRQKKAVPSHPGICCHSTQVSGSVCAVMDLSKQVFCAGMAYVALSRVKQMQNLRLIVFDVEAIKVSGKGLPARSATLCSEQ